jgi:hypothetical protein
MKIRYLLIIASLLVFTSITASAHVLLTTPYVVTGPIGVTPVSAPHVTMTGMSWTWGTNGSANLMSITYSFGTATFSGGVDTGFTVAQGAPTFINVLNMTTGAWTMTMMLSSGGSTTTMATGTLTTEQLAGALSAFTGPAIALRDFADYFLTLEAFMGTPMGTQPDLWQLGDM